jgi:Domain of unknown function (DUF4476)
MKTIFTLLFATVFTSAFAYDGSRLTITLATNRASVYVDGNLYQGQDSYELNDIQPGNHTIRIYKAQELGYGNANDRRRNRGGRNDRDLLYSTTLNVRPSYDIDIMVNRFGKAMVDERLFTDGNGSQDGNGNYDNGGYNGYNRAMTDADFNQLVQKIRGQWFGKLSTAKDAVDKNYFTTVQARQVIQLFNSESDKLDLAKGFYRNLVDRQNFRQLYDLFSYNSQKELDKYQQDTRY